MTGPLATFASGFAVELSRVGYTENSAADQVRLLAHLSRWLAGEGFTAAQLTPEAADTFLVARRAEGYTLWLSRKALAPLLTYLRGIGAVPPAPVAVLSPTERVLARFRDYLTSERGLTAEAAQGYAYAVVPFLRTHERPDGSLNLEALSPRDIAAFVVANVPGRRLGSAKLVVTSLRSLLGFLYVDGLIAQSLTSAVPSVAGHRSAGIPRAMGADQVQQLLDSCDRDTVVGRRDFAILTLLARMGLRAGEVRALELDDIDWRAGEIVVRGKGNRRERLPLPVDVGQALADYLRHGRPAADSRRMFLRVRAPRQPLSSLSAIVIGAAQKAGLSPIGVHRLRHTAATEMLRVGASLSEIGQLLRHRSALSTAMYAKVDRVALRELARPWPGGGAA